MPALQPEGENVCQPEKRWKIAVERGGFRKQQKEKKLFDFTFCLFVLEFSFLWPTRNSPPNSPSPTKLLLQAHFHGQKRGREKSGLGNKGEDQVKLAPKKMFRIHFHWKLIFFRRPSRLSIEFSALYLLSSFCLYFFWLNFFLFFKNLILEQPSLFTLLAGDYKRTNKSNKYIF